ncbi:MAG: hypothetical protein Q8K75_05415 [Chlamydiales bacterium]|nr:hypothetical protein [Chlamydiales bacterium]
MLGIKTMILSLVLLGGALHAAIVVQAGRSVIAVDPYSDRRAGRSVIAVDPYSDRRAAYEDRAYNYRSQPNMLVQRYDNYGPESYYYYYNDSPRRDFNYNYYYRRPIVYQQFYNQHPNTKYPRTQYHRFQR